MSAMSSQGETTTGGHRISDGNDEDVKEYRRWKVWVQSKMLTLGDKVTKEAGLLRTYLVSWKGIGMCGTLGVSERRGRSNVVQTPGGSISPERAILMKWLKHSVQSLL